MIQEICEDETVEEEEDKGDRDNENEIAVKPTQQDIQQAIETPINFSMFTESVEIGAIVSKASLLIELESHCSMRQMTIVDIFKAVENIVIFI